MDGFWTYTFGLCAGIVLYVYLGYPLLLYLLARLRPKPVDRAEITPPVSLIVAAHNEEKVIGQKIENSLALDYPNLEIIVASDCSTDRTDEIVASYKDRGVRLYRQEERRGKTAACNGAARMAKGEVLVFTDATAMLRKDCLRTIVRNFNDPKVGCVCPRLVYKNTSESPVTENEGFYWRYETWLRRKESLLGSLAFVSGACFAVRRELHRPVEPEYDYDCICPLDVLAQGYRVVYEPEAVFYDTLVSTAKDDLRTRIRMIVKDFAGTLSRGRLLDPFRNFLIAWTIYSHKLLRWLVPFFLVAMLGSNVFLLKSHIFKIFLFSQIAFYLWALIPVRLRAKNGLFHVPFHFCLMNLAAFIGVCKAATGHKVPVWQPVR